MYVLKTSYVFDVSSSLRRGANVRVVYIGLFGCSLAMMVVRVVVSLKPRIIITPRAAVF